MTSALAATDLRWTPLFGGRTNAAWRAQGSGQDVVVKLYSGPAQNPLFPNDPKAEARLLQHLAENDLAPKLRGTLKTERGDVVLYDHVPGAPWSGGVAEVAALMRRLHSLPSPNGLRQAPDGAEALAKQAMQIEARCRGTAIATPPATGGAPSAQGAASLLHSDIVAGNLIRNESGLHLIDWQCPTQGDPCEDIAVFLSPAMQHIYRGATLSDAEKTAFFDAYESAEIAARFDGLAPFFHWRMAAYCLWQTENGRQDYEVGLELEREAFHRSLSSIAR